MKIGKKLLLIIIPAILLISSCGIFKGEGKCDCPTFGETPNQNSNPDPADNS
jgi:hypothetical protein